MSNRISKKVREEAAMLCSMAACGPPDGMAALGIVRNLHSEQEPYYENVIWNVVADAVRHAYDKRDDGDYEAACAEAEAMLRTGWSPGDEL